MKRAVLSAALVAGATSAHADATWDLLAGGGQSTCSVSRQEAHALQPVLGARLRSDGEHIRFGGELAVTPLSVSNPVMGETWRGMTLMPYLQIGKTVHVRAGLGAAITYYTGNSSTEGPELSPALAFGAGFEVPGRPLSVELNARAFTSSDFELGGKTVSLDVVWHRAR